MVNRILVDRDTHNVVYAAFGGYNSDNLYKTTDNGQTWTNIAGNLPSVPVFTIVRNPVNANWLYAGTEVGLFTSVDGGNTWSTTNNGPANVEIAELSWLDNSTLLAATHGRGMFSVTISSTANYNFGGFNPPIRTGASAVNSVPVKFTLTDVNGNFITNAHATLMLKPLPSGALVTPTSTGNANVGNVFRIDPTSNQYIYNLNLKNLPRGTWQLEVTLDDGSPVRTTTIILK